MTTPKRTISPGTICELIQRRAEERPRASAILAPDGQSLSNQDLAEQLTRAADHLALCGLRHGQTVAVVLPNGPDLASAFLSVAAFTICAPLNPRLPYKEFVFALGDMGARALIVLPHDNSAVVEAAKDLGVPILELTRSHTKFQWDLLGPRPASDSVTEAPGPESVALYLHTAGTTARPKLVPLTHANLMNSAQNIANSLALGQRDCCLNVMPLFHIHGLVGALLSSLIGGGSIICTAGYEFDVFDAWIRRGIPTWYTAVPSIHQAILRSASDARGRLRFIRSSSAPLPPSVFSDLEDRFNVPVIEALGMTEASHQICSNPLPPDPRKPGSVGIPSGTEVRIVDAERFPVGPGIEGEVVVRGPGVMSGYISPATANHDAFTEGWFRTGDLGIIDADGYLLLSGRIKEIINRGGEKIAPREVDDVLLEHSDVAEAATFGVEHPTLGEDVVAAVVPEQSGAVAEHELLTHCRFRLAPHKVPSRILVIDHIPKGPTGKVRRVDLAASFRDRLSPSSAPPRTSLEETLARLFCDVLECESVGREDSFFQLGGDSLSAMNLLIKIEACTSRTLLPDELLVQPTVASLAAHISGRSDTESNTPLILVRSGSGAPILILPGDDGANVTGLRSLWTSLKSEGPIYYVRYPGLDGRGDPIASVEELAKWTIQQVQRLHPNGPYVLIGECFGGFVAFEIACRLEATGQSVGGLFLLNARAIESFPKRSLPTRLRVHWDYMQGRSMVGKWTYLRDALRGIREGRIARTRPFIADTDMGESELMKRRRRVYLATRAGLAAFRPRRYSGFVVVFNPRPLESTRRFCHFDPTHGWGKLAGDGAEAHCLARTNEDGVPTDDILGEVGVRISAHLRDFTVRTGRTNDPSV